MEVFVAGKSEEVQIAVVDVGVRARWQLVATTKKARARSMLEAAVIFANGVDQEEVAIERRLAVEEVDLPLAKPCKVARKSVEVRIVLSGDRDFVQDPGCFERDEREIAHLDRMVDQLFVALRAVAAESVRGRAIARERRRNAPMRERLVLRRQNFQ